LLGVLDSAHRHFEFDVEGAPDEIKIIGEGALRTDAGDEER
jgi:hypothetical protein